uniref:SEC-C domain-containing protein n=1 Tax=Bradyrhizobium symbiodeficiens TaxID=1404367 RepID=A0A6G8ZZ80_9BRAD|nr:hypothetical protein HAV00_04250 [Bradyrhizobium symbiodeficiens]
MTKRNAPCQCGSGRRFKYCHGQYETNSRSTRPQVRDDRRPSRAIEDIVASYFKMKDRRALFDLRAHDSRCWTNCKRYPALIRRTPSGRFETRSKSSKAAKWNSTLRPVRELKVRSYSSLLPRHIETFTPQA